MKRNPKKLDVSVERKLILNALEISEYDTEVAAKHLEMSKESIEEKIKDLGIESPEMLDEKTNGKKFMVDMNEYPELYDKLGKLSHMSIRTVEQQALFYIMQAIGETEVVVKRIEGKDDKRE